MLDQTTLRQEMDHVRSRGLVNAGELKQEVQRLADWREHVRSHPVPFVLATAALAYFLIPTRARRPRAVPVDVSRTQVAGNTTVGSASTVDSAGEASTKTAGIASLSGAAMGFAGSLIGNAVRSYIAEQLQTLIHTRGNHAVQSKR